MHRQDSACAPINQPPLRLAALHACPGDDGDRNNQYAGTHARNGTPVLLNGTRAPVVGRVSMDMVTIDLTDHPRYTPGDTVELWGKNLPANEIASCADTIAYDLFASVSRRVNFQYTTV